MRRQTTSTVDGGYAVLPLWLLDRVKDRTALAVYGVLDRHARKDTRRCWPGLDLIGRSIGVRSRATVRAAIGLLVDAGAVEIETRRRSDGGHASNVYLVHRRSPAARSEVPATDPEVDATASAAMTIRDATGASTWSWDGLLLVVELLRDTHGIAHAETLRYLRSVASTGRRIDDYTAMAPEVADAVKRGRSRRGN